MPEHLALVPVSLGFVTDHVVAPSSTVLQEVLVWTTPQRESHESLQ